MRRGCFRVRSDSGFAFRRPTFGCAAAGGRHQGAPSRWSCWARFRPRRRRRLRARPGAGTAGRGGGGARGELGCVLPGARAGREPTDTPPGQASAPASVGAALRPPPGLESSAAPFSKAGFSRVLWWSCLLHSCLTFTIEP